MKKNTSLLLLSFISGVIFGQSTFIHVDQFGYYADAVKVAVLSDPVSGFNASESYAAPATLEVIDSYSGQAVFSASPQLWNGGGVDTYSGDRGWQFDFSNLTTPGEYYLNDPVNNIQSHKFTINANPYLEVLKVAAKMFYYNRCNMEKVAPFAHPNWTDGTNFDHPLQDYNCRYIFSPNNAALEKDLSGGWFDAGDYNKYVTFTYSVIHDMLFTYQENPALFADNWNIPESGNGLPDLLDELKWELDWLKKMCNPDGSVHLKMGSQNYSENTSSPPSANTDQRFYGPTCTSASAAIASVFSQAAFVFGNIPGQESYAAELEAIAMEAYEYVLLYFNSNSLETECDNGSIVAGDADWSVETQTRALLSASVYLFALTDNPVYQQFLLNHAFSQEPLSTQFWGPYTLALEDALLFYAYLPNANNGLANSIIQSFTTAVNNNYNNFFGLNNLTLYRDFIPEWSYHWGSNNPKAQYGNLNYLAAKYNIADDSLNQRLKAEALLHAFHGVNPLGLVYLSNMYGYGAEKSINEIYHTWFNNGTVYDHALNSQHGPAPGYVTGGPNQYFSIPSISPPANQPITKSYLDWNTGWPENSWEISEPAIYYQSAYIRLLSQIIGRGGYTDQPNGVTVLEKDEHRFLLYPNPAPGYFVIRGEACDYAIQIINSVGQVVKQLPQVGVDQIIDISSLGAGTYQVRIENRSNRRLSFQTIIIK
ncbi:MAG TPA: glycoside hydrolase family 9 protein [Saprospiraceae bacterium]|nr:glycoside hydrolase family 9 protein [Saprospiraceae bacterium]HMQ85802.1 glycoside hydrolase family 9 protein [Saprospiraceae bacterium]